MFHYHSMFQWCRSLSLPQDSSIVAKSFKQTQPEPSKKCQDPVLILKCSFEFLQMATALAQTRRKNHNKKQQFTRIICFQKCFTKHMTMDGEVQRDLLNFLT